MNPNHRFGLWGSKRLKPLAAHRMGDRKRSLVLGILFVGCNQYDNLFIPFTHYILELKYSLVQPRFINNSR